MTFPRLDFLPVGTLFILGLSVTVAASASEENETGEIVFQELDLGEALVIEGRVEKPQVQFPLLMEKPPVNPIRFEMSFRDKMLELTRENVPDLANPTDAAGSAGIPSGTTPPPRSAR